MRRRISIIKVFDWASIEQRHLLGEVAYTSARFSIMKIGVWASIQLKILLGKATFTSAPFSIIKRCVWASIQRKYLLEQVIYKSALFYYETLCMGVHSTKNPITTTDMQVYDLPSGKVCDWESVQL